MHELRLSSRKPFVKCARVVGEVLGKFHPHGDTAVYDSLVRMAQVTGPLSMDEQLNLLDKCNSITLLCSHLF